MAANRGSAQRILDIAERLVQTRGFNGFSYADVAKALGVTKASLHYHFPTKGDLGRQLIERYTQNFRVALAEIDVATDDTVEQLRRYIAIYRNVLRANKMCLCGMLASDYATLPKPMRDELKHFFDENDRWLVAVLERGKAKKALMFTRPAVDVARTLVGTLEGAMMIARSYGDPERFEAVSACALDELAF